jgi:hypothetical protein
MLGFLQPRGYEPRHSFATPVTAINNDLTIRARRRRLGEKGYRQLSSYQEKKYKSFDGLYFGSANFAALFANGAFPGDTHDRAGPAI